MASERAKGNPNGNHELVISTQQSEDGLKPKLS
jgi:hypothetical protein